MTRVNMFKGGPRVLAISLLVACSALLLSPGSAWALTPIAQFRENVPSPTDPNIYLWSDANNWSWANTSTLSGLPKIEGQVEVGDDYSGPVSVYMDVPWAESYGVEIAEGFFMGRTAGSSMYIPYGSTLECYAPFQVGKDDKGFATIDGNLLIKVDLYSNSDFHIGNYGHYNARGTVVIGETGYVYAGAKVIVMGINMPGWGDSSGAIEFDYGSSLTVDGGRLTVRKGVKLYSPFAHLAGRLTITSGSTVTQDAYYASFFDIDGGGLLEIEGAGSDINLKVLDFLGGLDYDGNSNPAVLKLSGTGTSVINVAGAVTLGSDTLLDVSDLLVAPDTYTIINGVSIVDAGLAFAPGTDTGMWSFTVDSASGDLLVTYAPELAIPGDADGDGYVDDDDLSLLLTSWHQNTDWAHGEFSGSDPVDDDDLSILLTHWHEGVPPDAGEIIPEPATLLLVMMGGLVMQLRRRR